MDSEQLKREALAAADDLLHEHNAEGWIEQERAVRHLLAIAWTTGYGEGMNEMQSTALKALAEAVA